VDESEECKIKRLEIKIIVREANQNVYSQQDNRLRLPMRPREMNLRFFLISVKNIELSPTFECRGTSPLAPGS
jgi:hypothetical protein